MDLETLSFTSVVDDAIVVLYQSERAFLNVSQQARQIQFVLALKPPCYLGNMKRVKWTLEELKVLQISVSGSEIDRSADFHVTHAIEEFNSDRTMCLKLVSLEPSSANLKVGGRACKSNRFLVEFDFLLNYGSQAAKSTVRTEAIHVGSKSKNVGPIVYAEFVTAKQRFAESLQAKVQSLQTQMAGILPSALTNFVQTDILDANVNERLFTSDTGILEAYASKKRQRPHSIPAPGEWSSDHVNKLAASVETLTKRVLFLEALVSEHKRLNPESQVAALAAATAALHQQQLEPVTVPDLPLAQAPMLLQPMSQHLQAPLPLPLPLALPFAPVSLPPAPVALPLAPVALPLAPVALPLAPVALPLAPVALPIALPAAAANIGALGQVGEKSNEEENSKGYDNNQENGLIKGLIAGPT